MKAFAFFLKSFFEELLKLFWTANQFIEFPADLHSSFWIFKSRSQSLQVKQIPFSSITDLFVIKSISFSRDRTRCSNPLLTSSWTLPQISQMVKIMFFLLWWSQVLCWQATKAFKLSSRWTKPSSINFSKHVKPLQGPWSRNRGVDQELRKRLAGLLFSPTNSSPEPVYLSVQGIVLISCSFLTGSLLGLRSIKPCTFKYLKRSRG